MAHIRLPPPSYELTLSQNAGAPWEVRRIWIAEALNQPYHAVVDAESEADSPDTDSLLGCDAALTIIRGHSSRPICGLVSRIDFLGYRDHRLVVRFHIVPAFELLRQRVASRIWQGLSVQQILAKVLEAALGDYERSFDPGGISRGAATRDYCLQYRESDFAFVSRLLEEEGISYEFIHNPESRRETLTLRDANDQYAELENIDGTAEIPIIADKPGEADVESIQTLEWSKQLTITAATQRDYDWHTPKEPLTEAAEGNDQRGRERRLYVHGSRRFIVDDLAQQAKDQRLSEQLASQVTRGRSNVTGMRPGLRFRVQGHDRGDLEREYLITEVTHTGAEEHVVGEGGAMPYCNEFECVPSDMILRPRRITPKPREYGPQTAIVTGPDGEDIHTDAHGRVQVQFHWEQAPSYAAGSSCWVRCSQSWSGSGWGGQFIPRVGMEVVVEFLEGNPDRPLVTGCVYNGEHEPPFKLPDNKTQSGWRTNSSPGGEGFNELRFEDAAGNEQIYIHGQKDWVIEIEHDKALRVGNDERFEIGHDQTGQVGNDQVLNVGGNQGLDVGGNQTVHVGQDHSTTIDGNRTDEIAGDAHESVKGGKTVIVDGMLAQSVDSLSTIVGEDAALDVGGNLVVKISGDASESVVGDKKIKAHNSATEAKMVTIKAASMMVFQCGAASITLTSDGRVAINGSNLTLTGSGLVAITGNPVVTR
jgi:type VI secretion system secreted protein VgrG